MPNGDLLCVVRTKASNEAADTHYLAAARSADEGRTWTRLGTLLFKSQHGMTWRPNTRLDHVLDSLNQVSLLDRGKQTVTEVPSLGGCQPYPTADGNWVVWNHASVAPSVQINRYPFPGNKRGPLTLRRGVSQLLVKVTNHCGNYALACDLLNPKGEELTDVTYSVEAR